MKALPWVLSGVLALLLFVVVLASIGDRTRQQLAAASVAQASASQPRIERVTVKVLGENDEWTETPIRLARGDVIAFHVNGKVVVGAWIGAVGPEGDGSADRHGRLLAKIGAAETIGVGRESWGSVDDSGPLKLKVSDTKYTDNSGAFEVEVLRIPAGLMLRR